MPATPLRRPPTPTTVGRHGAGDASGWPRARGPASGGVDFSLEGSVSHRDPRAPDRHDREGHGRDPGGRRNQARPVAVRVLRLLRRAETGQGREHGRFSPTRPAADHRAGGSCMRVGPIRNLAGARGELHHHDLLEDARGRAASDPQPQEHERRPAHGLGDGGGRRLALAFTSVFIDHISKTQGNGVYDANDIGTIVVMTLPLVILAAQMAKGIRRLALARRPRAGRDDDRHLGVRVARSSDCSRSASPCCCSCPACRWSSGSCISARSPPC